jgi:hypothetical protein
MQTALPLISRAAVNIACGKRHSSTLLQVHTTSCTVGPSCRSACTTWCSFLSIRCRRLTSYGCTTRSHIPLLVVAKFSFDLSKLVSELLGTCGQTCHLRVKLLDLGIVRYPTVTIHD